MFTNIKRIKYISDREHYEFKIITDADFEYIDFL